MTTGRQSILVGEAGPRSPLPRWVRIAGWRSASALSPTGEWSARGSTGRCPGASFSSGRVLGWDRSPGAGSRCSPSAVSLRSASRSRSMARACFILVAGSCWWWLVAVTTASRRCRGRVLLRVAGPAVAVPCAAGTAGQVIAGSLVLGQQLCEDGGPDLVAGRPRQHPDLAQGLAQARTWVPVRSRGPGGRCRAGPRWCRRSLRRDRVGGSQLVQQRRGAGRVDHGGTSVVVSIMGLSSDRISDRG